MSSHGVPRTERERTEEERKRDLEKIEKYRALERQLRKQVSENLYDATTLELTTKLLRTNPEYYTVWNARRRCLISGPLTRSSHKLATINVSGEPPRQEIADHELQGTSSDKGQPMEHQQDAGQRSTAPDGDENEGSETGEAGISDVIRDELAFTVPLLMAHPKCYWIWNYRMWTLEQATSLLPVAIAKAIWQEELGLVSKMLSRDRRNFHAWAYRRYVVSQLESAQLAGQSMAESEFAYTTKMIGNDLSNFSAWHNRAQLIPKLLEQRNADDASRREFLDREFETVDNGLNVGPEDQSLWYYHQYLTTNVAEQPGQKAIASALTIGDRVTIIKREIEFCKDLLEDYRDVKWIFERLLEYTLLIHKLQGQSLSSDEKAELESWVTQIQKLDPQRSNRWKDLAEEMQITR